MDEELKAQLDVLSFCIAQLAIASNASGELLSALKDAGPRSSPAVQAELQQMRSVIEGARADWEAKGLRDMLGGT